MSVFGNRSVYQASGLLPGTPSTGSNRDHFLQADLNEAAGAADATRAMLRT